MKNMLTSIIGFLGLTSFSTTSYDSLPAAKKSEVIWESMTSTAYENLPQLGDQTWKIREFSNKHIALSTSKDFSACHDFSPGSIGTVIQVSFLIDQEHAPSFSGIFSTDAPYGFLRIALADPPSAQSYTPGLALRLLRDGHSSTTIFAIPSLDSQYEENLFTHNFFSHLNTPAFTLKKVVMADQFRNRLRMINQKADAIEMVSFAEDARITGAGQPSDEIIAPLELIFKPTPEAKLLFASSNDSYDFRAVLNGKGVGSTLFRVYAKGPNAPSKEIFVGYIVGTSNFVASELGDCMFNTPVTPLTDSLVDH